MGISATSSSFLSLIVQSKLLDEATLDKYVKDRAQTLALDDPAQVAGAMVRDGLLTEFQAGQLLQGKWKGFFIGRYKVLGTLGAGGMGKVFLCEHPGMRRQVAIKVLPPKMAADPVVVEGFYREAQALASLDHRNIVHAFDAANDGDVHYLVMEYVKGRTLESLVAQEGPLSASRAIDYLRQAALGLQHAFEAGLVHRDIKPSNFLVTDAGVVKILDLGLAQFFGGADSGVGSDAGRKPGEVMGTVDYMSPEQGLNAAAVDIRGDIYSLGATFYYCLSGKSPFQGGTTAQKILWHQIREPEPLQGIRGDLPPQLIDIVSRMMAKDPANRFQTPDEVLLALPSQEVLEAPAEAPQATIDTGLNLDGDSPTITVKKNTRRAKEKDAAPPRRISVTHVAGLSVALAAVAVGIYFASQPASKPTVEAPAGTPPPNRSNPKAQAASAAGQVFLSEARESEVSVGIGQLGKRNQLGHGNHMIVVKGEQFTHSLGMHPPPNGVASVRYEIGGRARTLAGAVAVNDSAKGQTKTPMIFVVKGDGAVKWESKPVRVADDRQAFTVDINGVKRLELEVRCPGDHGMAHAVWLDPAITLK